MFMRPALSRLSFVSTILRPDPREKAGPRDACVRDKSPSGQHRNDVSSGATYLNDECLGRNPASKSEAISRSSAARLQRQLLPGNADLFPSRFSFF